MHEELKERILVLLCVFAPLWLFVFVERYFFVCRPELVEGRL